MANPTSSNRVVLVGIETSYVPPAFVVVGVPEEDRPHTACASCPSGVWFQQPEWRCFCNVMKFQTWDGGAATISSCDGRETSVANYHEIMDENDDAL